MHSSSTLYDHLTRLLISIEGQISAVEDEMATNNLSPIELINDGRYVMSDLLLAKAQTLAAMVNLRTEKK